MGRWLHSVCGKCYHGVNTPNRKQTPVSLVVNNAYRFPIQAQRYIHTALMSRCVEKTTETVNLFTERLTHHVSAVSPDEWKAELDGRMDPSREVTVRAERDLDGIVRRANNHDGDVGTYRERFVRTYLMYYTRQIMANPSTWPMYDIGISWSYTWDGEYGYVALYTTAEIKPEQMVEGIAVLEPFSYDGRVGETDHPTIPADEVARTWDKLVGYGAMSFVGASASLSGFEQKQAFGLI